MEVMLKRISELWCGLMHDAAMWPIHGRYQCRTCGRLCPVEWEAGAGGSGATRSVTLELANASR